MVSFRDEKPIKDYPEMLEELAKDYPDVSAVWIEPESFFPQKMTIWVDKVNRMCMCVRGCVG